MKRTFSPLLLVAILTLPAKAQDTAQYVVKDRLNTKEQQQKPYVILISVDGLRADFVDRYRANNLARLRASGVQAEYMLPSFPSLTFPNHYTIVTGLYPAHHGLVDNGFRDKEKGRYSMGDKKAVGDGSWYGGTPLWVLAEQQGMLSASFFWVASESAIQNTRPSYYYIYHEKTNIDQRIQVVYDWLKLPEEKRPHLITFYLPQVDHAAHYSGPESDSTGESVRLIDSAIGKLSETLSPLQLPLNFVVVSDHGMTLVDNARAIPLPKGIDTTNSFTPSGETVVHLYAKESSVVRPVFQELKNHAGVDYTVYLSSDMPGKWHYSKQDDRYHRIGDIIMVPNPPAFFNLWGRRNRTIGKHGFDPFHPDMRASFYAWGPAFQKGLTIPAFENIHVFPMIASVLGLKYDPASIDGHISVLKKILE